MTKPTSRTQSTNQSQTYDLIIIGAGTAGLTAAIYACRAGKSVLILEELTYGGQIINTLDIENYPACDHISGVDYATNLYNQAIRLGADFKFESVTTLNLHLPDRPSLKSVTTEDSTYFAPTVILATGAKNRPLGLEHESELTGNGISYCATCDGSFYKNKIVAVNGGGNTALEDALYLANIAKTVYLIHRRDTFRAEQALVNRLQDHPNIKPILNSTITKLIPDSDTHKLKQIETTDKLTLKTTSLTLNGLFVAIGRIPATSLVKNYPDLKLTSSDYIITDDNCATAIPGFYVAGDCREKSVRQLVTAASDGCIAATSAIQYLDTQAPAD